MRVPTNENLNTTKNSTETGSCSNQSSNTSSNRFGQHPDLSDFQAAQLRFLKQEVSRCQDEHWRTNADKWSAQRLWYARDNLKRYVEQLRKLGKRV